MGRYSFTVVDSHHLLLAGLPAHSNKETGRKKQESKKVENAVKQCLTSKTSYKAE